MQRFIHNPMDVEKFKVALTKHLISLVKQKHPGKVSYRQLIPEDFGLTTTYWSWNLAAGINTFNFTVPNTTAIGVYGVFSRSPAPSAHRIEIQVGADTLRTLQLEELYAAQESYTYLDPYLRDPVILHENDAVTLRIWAETAIVDEKLGFIGIVAEPPRRVIRKPEYENVEWLVETTKG